MAMQEQFRKAVVQSRKANRLREDSMLGRVAHEVGLNTNEVADHNWKPHTN
jgi:hypothetical protein